MVWYQSLQRSKSVCPERVQGAWLLWPLQRLSGLFPQGHPLLHDLLPLLCSLQAGPGRWERIQLSRFTAACCCSFWLPCCISGHSCRRDKDQAAGNRIWWGEDEELWVELLVKLNQLGCDIFLWQYRWLHVPVRPPTLELLMQPEKFMQKKGSVLSGKDQLHACAGLHLSLV